MSRYNSYNYPSHLAHLPRLQRLLHLVSHPSARHYHLYTTMPSMSPIRGQQRHLSTGQRITLTPQEDRMLRRVYSFIAGMASRLQMQQRIEEKRQELASLNTSSTTDTSTLIKSYRQDQRSASEIHTDAQFQLKDELAVLEDKLRLFDASEHVISAKDIDVLLKNLGASMTKKQIEVYLLSRAMVIV